MMYEGFKLDVEHLKQIKEAQDSLFNVSCLVVQSEEHQQTLESALAVLDRLYCIHAYTVISALLKERGD